ncbi:MAG TPA: prolyl oligopeptidase family serine peptidase [Steroidobacteraceae bacterium]|nr:prolyl oligopeptidase family serine peptidase [Steroidobacteraceae bacterium]
MNGGRLSILLCSLFLSASLCSAADAPASPAATPPPAKAPTPARKVDVVDREHGLVLPDPYRWMEGENNAEFQTWLKQQGAYTRAQLEASPIRARWAERLKVAGSTTRLHRMQRPMAGRIFFTREDGGKEGVLMVRDPDGRERALFDPNTLTDASGHGSVTEYSASPDGKLVAVNVDRGGSEITRVQVVNVQTGEVLPDLVEPVWSEIPVSWLPDSSSFTYTQIAPDADQPEHDFAQNQRVRVHRVGTTAASDELVLKSGSNAKIPFDVSEIPLLDVGAVSNWAIAILAGARLEQRICVARLTVALASTAPWSCIVGYEDGVQAAALHRSTLYLLSTKGAPNGRVLSLDLDQPQVKLADAKVVLAESKDTVVTTMAVARDALYVRRMKNGLDTLGRIQFGTTEAEPIAMPFDGAAYLVSADPRGDGVVFTLQGWTRPRTAFRFDPATSKLTDLNLGATAPADYSDIVAVEAEATSADGTRVPLSILTRKDIKRDGKSLAILDGYGGYGISSQPFFDPLTLEWVKAGHVFAEAHVRGGGEKGNAWRLGGSGALKYKGSEDFIACAHELASLNLSAPTRTVATGASAGGILIGGAITRAPDQFGAAVITAGVLNPVRLLAGKNGANQIGELGDPRTAAGLKALAAMDAYQLIRDGVSYPPVMFMVGLNDNRVSPWESGKFGARLAAASRSGKPVWFRTDADTGHFGTTLSAQAAENADIYTFIEMQLK